jgi:hypothetical protein
MSSWALGMLRSDRIAHPALRSPLLWGSLAWQVTNEGDGVELAGAGIFLAVSGFCINTGDLPSVNLGLTYSL